MNKKIVAVLLSLSLIFCLVVPAFAVDAELGQLTIFSTANNHSFLTFKNTYSDPVLFGGLSVNRNQEITIGSFDMNSHAGIWYNLDSHFYHHAGAANQFSGRVSLTTSVTRSEMNAINDYISTHDTWSRSYNCAVFASNIWNLASTTTFYVANPGELTNCLRADPNHETDRLIPNSSPVGYVSNGLWYNTIYSLTPRVELEISATPIYSVVDVFLPAELALCSGAEKRYIAQR